MLRYFFLLCLLSKLVFAQDYFIHLNESALSNKPLLLTNQLENIAGIDNVAQVKSSQITFREVLPAKKSTAPFNQWLLVHAEGNIKEILENLSASNIIDFYEPVGRFKIDFDSNDSLASEQWYLDKIRLKEAWEISKGNPDIIVCVIDTGIDFVHPDLQHAIWINDGEDLNGNGYLDEQDINHIDDDNNGYVDDVVGWDFTDSPRFADGGDYRDEDNEPWDEFGSGHGTQAAGIIAARDNNFTGIAGIAPELRVMNLRAGTANGYLEEDDVGRAILYALNNGAKIVNMSFGDKALSRFLRDVITYAAQQGLIFIASSGNENSSEPHYPSSLPQVISVGASTKNDGIAGFSNYGNSLDLVAPGSEMISTAIGGTYNSVGGTSFSAPVVSGVAGLLLAHNAEFSADQIRNILKTSAKDVYYQGWDSLSAAGRIDAYDALQVVSAGKLIINYPQTNSTIATDHISIMGTAAHSDLLSTEISIGVGEFPDQWTVLRHITGQQIINDTLAVFEPQHGDTTYTVRIKMQLFNTRIDELHHAFAVDKTPPELSNVQVIDMWDGPLESKLITFQSDDICTAIVFMRPKGNSGAFERIISPYQTSNHRFKIDKKRFDGEYKFYVQAKNGSGLSQKLDNNGSFYSLSFEKDYNPDQLSGTRTLPAGFMLNTVSDFDHNGQNELALSHYDNNNGYGPVEVYEFNNGRFDLKLRTGFTAIPRAAGDSDQDGRSELLMGFGQNSFLFEASAPDSFPAQLIWKDTVNFWAAGFTDLDGDNNIEISGRVDNEYVLLENNGDNRFSEIGRLSNPTQGENRLGVPAIEMIDINDDNKDDLVFGDYDGDLLCYSASADNTFYLLATGHTLHNNATEIMTKSIQNTVFTATHTSENLNYEHEFDARYWSVESFTLDNDMLVSQDTIHTFGFSETRDFDSGLDYYLFDGKEYLFAGFFPHLYVFEKVQNQWQLAWYYDTIRSNTIVVYDFDKDGNDEFYFNDGKEIIGFTTALSERPNPPYAFSVNTLDSITVSLNWQKVLNASHYNIYRGQNADNLQLHLSSAETQIEDNVHIDKKYFYAVTSVDSSFVLAESFISVIDSVRTTSPPRFNSYEFSGDHQLVVNFNRPLLIDPERPATAYLSARQDYASSVIILNQLALLISFEQTFSMAINDTLYIDNVFGESGVPVQIANDFIPLIFPELSVAPYVKSTHWLSAKKLKIIFSETMDFDNGPAEFKVIPSGRTTQQFKGDSLNTSLIVEFSRETYLGGTGVASYLILDGLSSIKGVPIDDMSQVSLYREANALKNIKVYPQPLKPMHDKLNFANLPGDVEVTIFNINGKPVRHLASETVFGGISWDLKDDRGDEIASGIYIFNMTWNNKSEQGKIVIVR